MSDKLPSAKELINDTKDRYNRLVESTFNTTQGKELLSLWEKLHIQGQLFAATTRETDYNIAQRDFVLEIMAITNGDIK